ncbi:MULTISPECIES: stage V sporulation protein K [Carboxydothermus]|uniref:Stage V sporulation protein K n=2 Tax=Carboxydothermus TaxID=129957 RepID=Q3ACB1_CARHZ|nr:MULTISPECIES: stage V sporulation protein K [Carboxydothermus]ABB15070.1 stage V sporulation protein K [Carboxydothermus hydrogenoformans Z-2901]NYE58160.1 stage V sporulation protein K [Carboxydothermus ferrireducens DSM 11255]
MKVTLINSINTASPSKTEIEKFDQVSSLLKELDRMVGLIEVKEMVFEIYALAQIHKKRVQEKLKTNNVSWHMVFKGNPGTGKTTVARIIGKLFKEIGILTKGHLIEVERADLVGEYIGHTALKTREQLKKALGGVLFIDEAYSLARGGDKDFGREAIDVVVKGAEDYRDNLVIILAGYYDEMNYLLEQNPGLKSRFPIEITFPDYTDEELFFIAEKFLEDWEYLFSSEAAFYLKYKLKHLDQSKKSSGNARLIRNIIEKAIRRQAVRLLGKSKVTKEDLLVLEKEDLEKAILALNL